LTKTSQIVIIYTHRAAPARIDVPENGKTREETTKEGMEHGGPPTIVEPSGIVGCWHNPL